MQGFVAESFYGAYIKNRGDCCKYYKDKYVINRVYKTCLKNIIVGLFFNQSVVIVKIRQFCIGLSGGVYFLASAPGLNSTNKSNSVTLWLGKN